MEPPQFTILLVEDNPDDERLAVRALQRSGVPVHLKVARDGAEATGMLEPAGSQAPQRAELPQLVLLDLKLPKLSGIEVLRRIREHSEWARVPVVVLTSSDEEKDLLACYDLHCNAYVRKPVDFDHFMDTVKKIAEFWLRINRLPAMHVHPNATSFRSI